MASETYHDALHFCRTGEIVADKIQASPEEKTLVLLKILQDLMRSDGK